MRLVNLLESLVFLNVDQIKRAFIEINGRFSLTDRELAILINNAGATAFSVAEYIWDADPSKPFAEVHAAVERIASGG